ncbi:sugar ABC transporter ATP-binding protein [Aneurinibacillus danicus]|uniref:Ribose import ATP-binding protein RbsA n=1 Tax=Aneurinibacillus danicus TaxID=267746 RepID=A0A511V7K6_9BACL|nr:sugar ABC transporter ATP-binding protein [Aneurinibacillus danicus]GEN34779.1 ribose import ATP-binding protein RbsA [Aneurinibacillus danicus]
MLLEIDHVSKCYGTKTVLDGVSMNLKKGEIHALLGKNGAGKTTLVKSISGVTTDYDGTIRFEGKSIDHLTVLERQKIGIYVVPQHASVIPEFTVAENIFIGDWPRKKNGFVDWNHIYIYAKEALDKYGVSFSPRQKVKDLSLVDQRKLNIVRALFSNAKLIILDEPTTALSAEERDGLFEFVIDLAKQGTSFIFISHYIEEVLRLSDRYTVLRDGKSYTGFSRGEVDERQLSNLIVGEDVELCVRERPEVLARAPIALQCSRIKARGLTDVSFHLAKGEILGLIGFPGSGAREICRALAGLNPIESGEIRLHGKKLRNPRRPDEALAQKIVYVSYDRHAEGIVPDLPIRENISLPILKSKLASLFGFVNERKEIENAQQYFSTLNIKAHSIYEEVGNLSGGNQQKVVISKALSTQPDVLIIDEPTVGIDVKSREEILSLINELTDTGLSVLYLTNDYNELLRVADRLLFFANGTIAREEINTGLTPEEVIQMRDSAEEEVAS